MLALMMTLYSRNMFLQQNVSKCSCVKGFIYLQNISTVVILTFSLVTPYSIKVNA